MGMLTLCCQYAKLWNVALHSLPLAPRTSPTAAVVLHPLPRTVRTQVPNLLEVPQPRSGRALDDGCILPGHCCLDLPQCEVDET
eukprot:6082300-Heterocapsa_arctica.AAC.1